jgi:hypothetical protein
MFNMVLGHGDRFIAYSNRSLLAMTIAGSKTGRHFHFDGGCHFLIDYD